VNRRSALDRVAGEVGEVRLDQFTTAGVSDISLVQFAHLLVSLLKDTSRVESLMHHGYELLRVVEQEELDSLSLVDALVFHEGDIVIRVVAVDEAGEVLLGSLTSRSALVQVEVGVIGARRDARDTSEGGEDEAGDFVVFHISYGGG